MSGSVDESSNGTRLRPPLRESRVLEQAVAVVYSADGGTAYAYDDQEVLAFVAFSHQLGRKPYVFRKEQL